MEQRGATCAVRPAWGIPTITIRIERSAASGMAEGLSSGSKAKLRLRKLKPSAGRHPRDWGVPARDISADRSGVLIGLGLNSGVERKARQAALIHFGVRSAGKLRNETLTVSFPFPRSAAFGMLTGNK